MFVTALCPGPVETGFQAASNLERSRLLSGPARLTMLSADEVARQGVRAMLAGQPVVIPGRLNQVQSWVPRLLPRGTMTRLIRTVQERKE